MIKVPPKQSALLMKVLDIVNQNQEVHTLWEMCNVTAVKRLSMTDHGPNHFQIVTTNALTLLKIFKSKGVKPSICQDYKLSHDYAEVVVLLTSLFHDLGMSVHRVNHEEYSLFLSHRLLCDVLSFLPTRERTIVISETLHAIISHRSDGTPLTLEAGIVRVADALDMAKGRSRYPYKKSKIDIHSVSARAIDTITIAPGRTKPIQIEVTMNHTAGIFQVDELLKRNVVGSGIEGHLEIKIYIDKGKGRELFKDFYQRQ